MRSKNVTYEKAYKYLDKEKKEFVLSKQLLRSGTSIGVNLAEANGAIFDADEDADELAKILFSILKSTRIKK